MAAVTKPLIDGVSSPFNGRFWDDGSNALAPTHSVLGTLYTATTITLSSGQAAGTAALLAANASRRALMFRAASDFEISPTASATAGIRIYASARDSFVGQECPTNTLYLVAGSGLVTGSVLTVWEG